MHPFIHPPIHLSIHPSIHPPMYPSIHLFIYAFIYVYASIYLSIYLSIYPSIHPSIHPYILLFQSPFEAWLLRHATAAPVFGGTRTSGINLWIISEQYGSLYRNWMPVTSRYCSGVTPTSLSQALGLRIHDEEWMEAQRHTELILEPRTFTCDGIADRKRRGSYHESPGGFSSAARCICSMAFFEFFDRWSASSCPCAGTSGGPPESQMAMDGSMAFCMEFSHTFSYACHMPWIVLPRGLNWVNLLLNLYRYGGVSTVMEISQIAGWFSSGKNQFQMDDDWGYSHDYGTPPYDLPSGKLTQLWKITMLLMGKSTILWLFSIANR